MNKFRVQLPGKFVNLRFGQDYYALDKKHKELCVVGIEAPDRIAKRYNFEFDEELAKEYGIDELPRVYEVDQDV